MFVPNLISMKQELSDIFKKNGGYVSRKEIDSRTLYYHLLSQVKDGIIDRVRSGVYYYNPDDNHLMIDIDKVVPKGVLCLYSAWFYYELSLQIPQSYCIAIENSRKPKLPDYPPITLYFWKKEHQELGVIHKVIDGYKVPIYNMEKCVCDAVKYRNKVGIDVCSEVIKEYLKRKERDLMLLMQYARIMRIEKTLKKYLEIAL